MWQTGAMHFDSTKGGAGKKASGVCTGALEYWPLYSQFLCLIIPNTEFAFFPLSTAAHRGDGFITLSTPTPRSFSLSSLMGSQQVETPLT